MRWYIIKALLQKEFARHLANRGGIALALLLVAAAVLLSVFAPRESAGGGTNLVGGVNHCYIEYDRATPMIKHLMANVPPDMQLQIEFRQLDKANTIDGVIVYQTGTAALQIRQPLAKDSPTGRDTVHVSVWHPDGKPTALAAYEQWLWKEIRRAYTEQARTKLPDAKLPAEPTFDPNNQWAIIETHKRFQEQVEVSNGTGKPVVPDLAIDRKGLGGNEPELPLIIATGMVIFSLYFACVYLLPTLNCEERERGVLLAQALTPASPFELLVAKFLFYPAFGFGLAATIAAIVKPEVLSSLYFWLALLAVGGGFLGIGMTIASLAKTQRAAFLGGMCYLLSVSMILLICAINHIPFLSYLAVEFHGPRVLYAAMSQTVDHTHWLHLMAALALATVWLFAAGWIFRRRGWQ